MFVNFNKKKLVATLFTSFLLLVIFAAPEVSFADEKTARELQEKLSLFPGERPALTDFRLYVARFYTFSIGASILIAVMMMMIGGVIWLTSAGNPGRISTAKEYIVNSLIGVVLLLGAYTIVQAVNPKLVNLNDPNLPPIPSFGICIVTGAPKSPEITDATHTCTVLDLPGCEKVEGDFVTKESCGQRCRQYSSIDGSCSFKGAIQTKFAEINKVLNSAKGSCTYTKLSSNAQICIEIREAQCVKNSDTSEPTFVKNGVCPRNQGVEEEDRCINQKGEYFYGTLGFDRLTPRFFLNSQELCLEHVCKKKQCEVNTAVDLHPNPQYTLSCTCKDPA